MYKALRTVVCLFMFSLGSCLSATLANASFESPITVRVYTSTHLVLRTRRGSSVGIQASPLTAGRFTMARPPTGSRQRSYSSRPAQAEISRSRLPVLRSASCIR